VLVGAGVLMATGATTAHATRFRADGSDLIGLYRAEAAHRDATGNQVRTLRADVEAATDQVARSDQSVAGLQRRARSLAAFAGVDAVHGPGVEVTLDDASPSARSNTRFEADDLVVHQQDVQAVVNALWAGGAEAMMIQGQRIISTSAIRCVGNTLILQGKLSSPPYAITAIGNTRRLKAALQDSPQVDIYLEYVKLVGLGWKVETRDDVSLPAYDGSLELRYAHVAPSTTR